MSPSKRKLIDGPVEFWWITHSYDRGSRDDWEFEDEKSMHRFLRDLALDQIEGHYGEDIGDVAELHEMLKTGDLQEAIELLENTIDEQFGYGRHFLQRYENTADIMERSSENKGNG